MFYCYYATVIMVNKDLHNRTTNDSGVQSQHIRRVIFSTEVSQSQLSSTINCPLLLLFFTQDVKLIFSTNLTHRRLSKFAKFIKRYNCVENDFCMYCCDVQRACNNSLVMFCHADVCCALFCRCTTFMANKVDQILKIR